MPKHFSRIPEILVYKIYSCKFLLIFDNRIEQLTEFGIIIFFSAIWNVVFRWLYTTFERVFPDVLYALRDDYFFKFGATLKGRFSDLFNTFRDGYPRQRVAVHECLFADADDRIRDINSNTFLQSILCTSDPKKDTTIMLSKLSIICFTLYPLYHIH